MFRFSRFIVQKRLIFQCLLHPFFICAKSSKVHSSTAFHLAIEVFLLLERLTEGIWVTQRISRRLKHIQI